MNYLVGIRTWLRKVLSLPRIDLRSVLVIGGFLFVGLPMMGDALQMSLDLVWPDAAQSIPARLVFAFVFFALAVYLLEKNSLPLEEKEEGNPKPRRFVVVLASEKLPVDLAPLQQGTRDERFSAFQKLAGSYSWLGGVVRIVEWHAPCLDRLYILCTKDGWDQNKADLLQVLLGGYLEEVGKKRGSVPEVECRIVGDSLNYEAARAKVMELQKELEGRQIPNNAVIFDFTGSTKPVSVGMVMACLDQRFDLEYLSQMRETPAAITAPYQRWGWGLLPFQKGDPGAIAGQLPIIIHTDAASILDNVQS